MGEHERGRTSAREVSRWTAPRALDRWTGAGRLVGHAPALRVRENTRAAAVPRSPKFSDDFRLIFARWAFRVGLGGCGLERVALGLAVAANGSRVASLAQKTGVG